VKPRAWRTAAAAAVALAVLQPLLPLAVWAASRRWFFPALLPEGLSGRAWSYLFSPASRLAAALGNSLVIGLAVTALCVLLGVPAGKALGSGRFRGRSLFELLFLAPLLTPGLAVLMGVQVLFIRLGLADTMAGVVLAHLLPTLPYMVIVMAGVFANQDPDFEQQAYSLGAGPLRAFLRVTLPAVAPGIVTGGLFAFLISWSQYILSVLVGGGRVLTLPVLLFAFAAAGDHSITAAVCLLFVAPAVLILLLTSRYLTGRSAGLGGFVRL
jgi:putative spermidine/putrescine transport system permease protein